jgi:tetratricopeptide (TPR) repeat protein
LKDMTQESKGSQDIQLDSILEDAYTAIREDELDNAIELLEKGLSIDFENTEVVSALKYVNFWRERERVFSAINSVFEKGEYLLNQWKVFNDFCDRIGRESERCLNSLRQYVFSKALHLFESLLDESGNSDGELMLRIGRCYKGKGEYDKALECLSSAARERQEDPEILAELADCYALVNEENSAKVFFREAFFIAPQKIDITNLESEMIKRLVDKVKEMGYQHPVLEEWIPVYGVLFGIFTVKRELRSIEYGKLKQSIYALERENRENSGDKDIVVPRLINRYFWLIDYYMNVKDGRQEDRKRINEILLKLKELNAAVYHQYAR